MQNVSPVRLSDATSVIVLWRRRYIKRPAAHPLVPLPQCSSSTPLHTSFAFNPKLSAKMGKMRIEKAKSTGPTSYSEKRFSHAMSQRSERPAPANDATAFEFGLKRASTANPKSAARRRRTRKEFTWMGILRFKMSTIFGGVRDTMPGPGDPLPDHLTHSIPRPESRAQTVC